MVRKPETSVSVLFCGGAFGAFRKGCGGADGCLFFTKPLGTGHRPFLGTSVMVTFLATETVSKSLGFDDFFWENGLMPILGSV